MDKFSMYAKFQAQPGARDSLVEILLEAAAGAGADPDCELYVVNVSEKEPEAVWVTEVWSSKAAHDASLQDEATRAMIQRAMPLIAGVESIPLRPVGGKGIK